MRKHHHGVDNGEGLYKLLDNFEYQPVLEYSKQQHQLRRTLSIRARFGAVRRCADDLMMVLPPLLDNPFYALLPVVRCVTMVTLCCVAV